MNELHRVRRGGAWMNDDIVNFAIQIYFDEQKDIDAFYYTSLHVSKMFDAFETEGNLSENAYQIFVLLRNRKGCRMQSFLHSELMFFPVHFNHHWSLAVVVRPLAMVRLQL